MSDNAALQVRIGGLFLATVRAIRAAPVVFLIAWLARLAFDALVPALRERGSVHMASGPRIFVLRCVSGVGIALISGLLIRWLLEPKRDSLRLNVGLAVYVTLMACAYLVPQWFFTLLSLKAAGSGFVANLALSLIIGVLAFWPIALMMGDRVSPLRAIRLMAPVYWLWILVQLILVLPGVAAVGAAVNLLHLDPSSIGGRVGELAVYTFTGTVSTFVLAYIYARRVRGEDLPGN